MIDVLVRFAAPVEDRPAELPEPRLARADPPRRGRGVPLAPPAPGAPVARPAPRVGPRPRRSRPLRHAQRRRPRRRCAGRVPHHRLRLAQGGTLMKPLRTFRLEEYLGEWEFKVRHHLTASDAQSMTIEELLALGTDGRPRGPHEASALVHRDLGHAGAARGGRRHLRARRRRSRAGVRGRRRRPLLGDAGAGRPRGPRGRHRAVLPGHGDGDRGDRRGRQRAGAAP